MLVRVGRDAADEGYFIEQATRVVQGQLPYRDFDSLYTPALLYVHAAIVRVFLGSPLVDLRTVGLLARLVLVGGLYLVCRPLVRPAIASLPLLYVRAALDRPSPRQWEYPGVLPGPADRGRSFGDSAGPRVRNDTWSGLVVGRAGLAGAGLERR